MNADSTTVQQQDEVADDDHLGKVSPIPLDAANDDDPEMLQSYVAEAIQNYVSESLLGVSTDEEEAIHQQQEEGRRPFSSRDLKSLLHRMEGKIHKAARMELELLGKAAALRERRIKWSKRYEVMSKKLLAKQEKQRLQAEDSGSNDESSSPTSSLSAPSDAFTPAELPPAPRGLVF